MPPYNGRTIVRLLLFALLGRGLALATADDPPVREPLRGLCRHAFGLLQQRQEAASDIRDSILGTRSHQAGPC